MKTLRKYLKPYIGLIILSIILLFGQAISNLSLPNYMSDIVNVGIQQAGIDDPSPKVISKNGMDLLSFFMRENDKEFFTGNYMLILPDSQEAEEYVELYPLLETDAIYIQKDGMDYDDVASDETIYNWAVYAFINYMQDVAGAGNAQSSYDSSMNAIDVDTSQLYQFIPVFEHATFGYIYGIYRSCQKHGSLIYKTSGYRFHRCILQGGRYRCCRCAE